MKGTFCFLMSNVVWCLCRASPTFKRLFDRRAESRFYCSHVHDSDLSHLCLGTRGEYQTFPRPHFVHFGRVRFTNTGAGVTVHLLICSCWCGPLGFCPWSKMLADVDIWWEIWRWGQVVDQLSPDYLTKKKKIFTTSRLRELDWRSCVKPLRILLWITGDCSPLAAETPHSFGKKKQPKKHSSCFFI